MRTAKEYAALEAQNSAICDHWQDKFYALEKKLVECQAHTTMLLDALASACPDSIEEVCDECSPGPCVGCWVKDARAAIALQNDRSAFDAMLKKARREALEKAADMLESELKAHGQIRGDSYLGFLRRLAQEEGK